MPAAIGSYFGKCCGVKMVKGVKRVKLVKEVKLVIGVRLFNFPALKSQNTPIERLQPLFNDRNRLRAHGYVPGRP
jgi:hypothetical protein